MTADRDFAGHELRVGFYQNRALRQALNAQVQQIFGLDFTPWNVFCPDSGDYTPFSLFDGERVIANVSASPMHLVIGGRRVEAVQIGTVGTLPEARRRGLIRRLMDEAHDHWQDRCELFFLFANDTVLEFYQQFGYRRVECHTFCTEAPPLAPPERPARRLDLGQESDRELLFRLAEERAPVSGRLGISSHCWLLLFHAAVGYPQQLSYIESLDVIVISQVIEAACRIVDVIGSVIPTFEQIYPFVGTSEATTVEFAFTPDLMGLEGIVSNSWPGAGLFVRGGFAVEGEPFRFPETSEA